MISKIKYITFVLLVVALSTNAQDRKLRKANESYNRFEYYKAIRYYEDLVTNGNRSPEILRNLGDANYNNANYKEAAKWYTQLADATDIMDIEHMYRHANTMRSIKEYKMSDKLFEKIQRIKGVGKIKSSVELFEDIKEREGSYIIENIAINSAQSDFAPSFRLDGIVFSTGRDTTIISKNIDSWNKKRFLNLFTANETADGSLGNIMRFSGKLNTKLHESSTAFSKDGMTVYFTRNKKKKGGFGRDKKGVSRLKLYKAVFKKGKWTNITELPFNQDGYSVAHPTLNKAEDKLYFASDMPGTVGQSDIYVVDIGEDGTYSTPKNLSSKLNTIGRETFPFVTDENILYFASDGHIGLGGLDIFAINLNDLEHSEIVNLGAPINSVADDFSFIINTNTKKGYFSSNRGGGLGADDIYAFTEVKPMNTRCFSNYSGLIKNKTTGDNITNAKVVLIDDKGESIAETISDDNGIFTIKSNCNEGNYTMIASKEDYDPAGELITKKENQDVSNIVLLLSNIDLGAPVGSDLVVYLNIEPIYFNLNEWTIKPSSKPSIQKIIDYLNKYTAINLRIISHTDSRATKAYNLRLSNKRANTTMEYLIENGIAANRLSTLGFGETMLVNECEDNVYCEEEKHQKNRRSEFILVE